METAEFEIQLRDVLIYARHGVMPEESVTGNQYRVNIRVVIGAEGFDEDADDLDSTISYADLYDVLADVMQRPCALLESVAVRFSKILMCRWPFVKSGEIEIVKTVPPIPAMIGQAAVKYRFEKKCP